MAGKYETSEGRHLKLRFTGRPCVTGWSGQFRHGTGLLGTFDLFDVREGNSDMVCVTSLWQSPIQAVLRPGVWVPGVRNLHSHRESWLTDVPADEGMELVLEGLKTVVKTDKTRAFYDVHKVDRENKFIRIFALTWAEWLDVVEIQVYDTRAEVYSFSSGVLPISFPFAFILNSVFFFVPFSDNGLNKERLEKIRLAMGENIRVIEGQQP